jgi:hypothetical protein
MDTYTTLNEVVVDKIRQYHSDYNNRPSNDISFMPVIDPLCLTPPIFLVYTRRVDPSVLVFSLSSHRHSYISLLFSSHLFTE